MEQAYLMLIAIAISAIMAVEAYKLQCLTKDGMVASFLVGSFVGVFASISAFFILTIFTIAGFIATIRGIDRKKAQGLQEGQLGERTWKNVFGVGVPPCIAVALNLIFDLPLEAFAILFISTIAVAGADTIASEVGVKDPKAYMITTGKRVEPGTNGGISILGTAVSTVIALMIAVMGWYVMTESLSVLLLIPFAMGVFGNLLDSVFGAVLENPGYISKYINNGSTEMISGLLGVMIYFII